VLGPDESLALCGMMGSGKSTVAALLGRLTGRRVVSTDARVERLAARPIARIFAEEGEGAFRALERRVVRSLPAPAVIDLGGGAFCDAQSAERMLGTARVVFLDVSAAEAARRIGHDPSRPLSGGWAGLAARRLPLYRRAHRAVRVDRLTAEAVARRILGLLAGAGPAAPPGTGWAP
jgi:shikimate kinase